MCSIDGCDNKRKSGGKGMCSKHYVRNLKYGDPHFVKWHRKSKTPEYYSWESMIQRCTNKNNPFYHRYGGRGITVCSNWLESFEQFLADMGTRPQEGFQLDRRDNDGDYTVDNCRWIDSKTNARNSSHTQLTLENAVEIRSLYHTGKKQLFIAKMFNTTQSNISRIVRGLTWV